MDRQDPPVPGGPPGSRPASPPKRPREAITALALFATTLLTTLAAGAYMAGKDPSRGWSVLGSGVPFALPLLAILGTHELGHYWTARRNGIRTSLPYFIPGPPPLFFLGTFGAVIRLRSPAPNRSALLRMAAAGPWAGMAVALPVLAAGLLRSRWVPDAAASGAKFVTLGDSLLTGALQRVLLGPAPDGRSLMLDPVAFAGWVGCLVTSLNLLPMAQLDGGHILYALLPRLHARVGKVFALSLGVLGFLAVPAPLLFGWSRRGWPGWWLWAILPLFLGFRHPPPLLPERPLQRGETLLAAASFLLLALVFLPVPISLGGE